MTEAEYIASLEEEYTTVRDPIVMFEKGDIDYKKVICEFTNEDEDEVTIVKRYAIDAESNVVSTDFMMSS